ncbi:MAG: magnesium/cobalt transporter CorA [Verrucomicrobia bacterium]|nr:magnesium/cobalt transporter CorA [Verrucomicrobiota bacterium]
MTRKKYMRRRRTAWVHFKRFLRRKARPYLQKFFPKNAGTSSPSPLVEEDEAMEIGLEPGALPIESPFDTQETAQFRVVCYDESGYSLDEFSDADRLSDFANRPGMVWVQMMGMKDPQQVHVVGALFNIPMLAQEDIVSEWSRPKFEEYGEMILAVTRAVRLGVEELQPRGQQISFVAGPNFLISFHEKRELVFENIERRIAENSGKIRKWGSPYLLYALIDALVDRMLHLTDEIEDAITDLEEDTVKDDSDPDTEGENIRTVYRMKRLVIRLGRMIYPLRDMVRTFERYDHPMLPPEMDMYFSDLYDHTLRAFDRIEHARMILQELQDFYHTEHERHTSDVLRVLTVVTAIFVPLTCIAGIYGMNFKNIPELNTEYGYFVTLGVMVAFIVASVIFFRVKRWM